MTLWLLILYALAVVGVLLWGGIVGLRFKGTLRHAHLPDNPPRVSTIVPARNEERNISRCVRGLTGQDYPALEMVFVDDDSQDATPRILADHAHRDPRIRVVQTGGKPEGWNGKQWACHTGAMTAIGDWLCFMDADTYAEPHLLSRTMAFSLNHRIDMLSLQPWYETCGLWERIVLPPGLMPLFLLYPPGLVNNPYKDLAIANGQFILIRRDVYDAVQGHAGVRERMMDDFSLAQNVKRAGHRLYIADGMDVMRVRLYTNLREIRSGALKAAVEITGGWLKSTIGLIAILSINVLPVLLLVLSLIRGDRLAALILGIIVAFLLGYYAVIRMAAFRAPPWSSVTYPFGGIIVTAILLDGMIRVATGREIKWKDRPLLGIPTISIKDPVSTRRPDHHT